MIFFLLSALFVWLAGASHGFWFGLAVGLWYGKRNYYDDRENSFVGQWDGFRRSAVWVWLKRYLGFAIEYEDQSAILEDHPYVYAIHPHGVLALGHMLGFAIHGGDGVHPHGDVLPLAHGALFWIPFLRDVVLWAGAKNVTGANFEHFLRSGRSVSVAPGGLKEILLCSRAEAEVYEGHRGFLRVAEKTGAEIVPVLILDENRACWPVPFIFPRVRRWLARRLDTENKFLRGVVTVAAVCTSLAAVGPFPCRLTLVVGAPMKVEKDGVDEAHEAFYAKLKEMRKKHRPDEDEDEEKGE